MKDPKIRLSSVYETILCYLINKELIMNKKIVHNPVLCLIRERVTRKLLPSMPAKIRKMFEGALASDEDIKKWEQEVSELD